MWLVCTCLLSSPLSKDTPTTTAAWVQQRIQSVLQDPIQVQSLPADNPREQHLNPSGQPLSIATLRCCDNKCDIHLSGCECPPQPASRWLMIVTWWLLTYRLMGGLDFCRYRTGAEYVSYSIRGKCDTTSRLYMSYIPSKARRARTWCNWRWRTWTSETRLSAARMWTTGTWPTAGPTGRWLAMAAGGLELWRSTPRD